MSLNNTSKIKKLTIETIRGIFMLFKISVLERKAKKYITRSSLIQ